MQPQQNPVLVNAFQSVAPHPAQLTQNPAIPIQLPKEKKSFGGLITTVALIVALLAALGFGIWAFMSMSDYKNNSDKKSAAAVTKALADQKVKSDAEYAEKDKLPYDTYTGPGPAGSIKMQYPRTWSAYISESSNGSSPVVGYIHPGFVPDIQNNATAFALRIEVVNTQYSEVLRQYDSEITQGGLKFEPFSFPSVPGSMGGKLTGKIKPGVDKVQGTLILMPVRDKTIKLWTESNSAFGNDFNTAIVPNFSFVP
jgi:hypothetical protein